MESSKIRTEENKVPARRILLGIINASAELRDGESTAAGDK